LTNLLEQRRRAAGLTIEELAESSGVPYQRLRRHLYGESGGTLSALEEATLAMSLVLAAKARLESIVETVITSRSQATEIIEAKRVIVAGLFGLDPSRVPLRGEDYNTWRQRMAKAGRQ